jgi:hypothetical protein
MDDSNPTVKKKPKKVYHPFGTPIKESKAYSSFHHLNQSDLLFVRSISETQKIKKPKKKKTRSNEMNKEEEVDEDDDDDDDDDEYEFDIKRPITNEQKIKLGEAREELIKTMKSPQQGVEPCRRSQCKNVR